MHGAYNVKLPTNRQTDRQTDIQTDRQTDRQAYRRTDRQVLAGRQTGEAEKQF